MKAHFWISLIVVAIVFYAVGAVNPGLYTKAASMVRGG